MSREVPFRINISLSGEQDVSRGLEALETHLSDLTPAWPGVDDVFHAIVRQQFATEGQHGGNTWPALARRTQLERRSLGYGPAHPILRRTGALERSLTTINSDAISVHLPLQYRRGTGVEYFGYHQSLAPRKRIPRRAPIHFTADDRHELARPIRIYIRGGISTGQGLRVYAGQSFAPTTGGAP